MPRTLRMFKDQVILRDKVDQGEEESDADYGTPLTYLAKVEYGAKQIRNKRGEEAVASVTVAVAPATVADTGEVDYLDEVPQFSPEVELTLPNGDSPLIQEVRSTKDDAGRRWVELYA